MSSPRFPPPPRVAPSATPVLTSSPPPRTWRLRYVSPGFVSSGISTETPKGTNHRSLLGREASGPHRGSSDTAPLGEVRPRQGPDGLPGTAQRTNETSAASTGRPARRWQDGHAAGRGKAGASGLGAWRGPGSWTSAPQLRAQVRTDILDKVCGSRGTARPGRKAPETSASFGGPSCPTGPGRRVSERPRPAGRMLESRPVSAAFSRGFAVTGTVVGAPLTSERNDTLPK